MAKVARTNSKKGVRPRAKLSKPRPPAGTSAGQDGAEPKGIRRAFFKLEELGRKLRSQKENLVIDWEIDVPEEKQEGEKAEGEGEKEAGEMEKPEENVLQPLANTVSTQLTTITPADTLQPIAPPPTPIAQRTVHSSPGNIFVNGGHSHRLSSTRQCPSSPPRPGTRIALQNSDSNLDEDLVILSTLENSAEQPLPFCCHEELLEMAPPQLVEVAKKLNACLPAALAIRTELGYGYGPEELTRNIERVVGIRTEPVETPMHVQTAQAAVTATASSGPEIPFHRLSEVVSSVFKEEFDDASESDFPSPPTSPLARTKYARFSIFNPGTKLTPLREEETMKAAETLLSLPTSQRAVGQGASPLLPNPWEDADPAVFADVSTMADADMTDEEEDEETTSEPDTDVKSRPGPRIPSTPSSSSLSSMESLPTPKPASKVRRTQSMRVPYAPKADSAISPRRVLRSQSQRVPDTGTSGMASKAKARRTSVGALANRDTSFITTKRPSYRFKVALEAKGAVASGSKLKRSLSERQRPTVAEKDKGLGRRSTIAGAQIREPTSTKASAKGHQRAKSLIPVASTKRKRRGEKAESDDEDTEDED